MRPTTVKTRRTGADMAIEYLEDAILTLKLLPGAKISEAEIAAKLGLSRQPVREAFLRLDSSGLLKIQPQKATTVRKFSMGDIAAARFTRRAIEIEVLHDAVANWDGTLLPEFEANLEDQKEAAARKDVDRFHALDFAFHQLLCRCANADAAFDIIVEKKSQIARICLLSLSEDDEMDDVVHDHQKLLELVQAKDFEQASELMRQHLSRLNPTIQSIYETHKQFFEDQ